MSTAYDPTGARETYAEMRKKYPNPLEYDAPFFSQVRHNNSNCMIMVGRGLPSDVIGAVDAIDATMHVLSQLNALAKSHNLKVISRECTPGFTAYMIEKP